MLLRRYHKITTTSQPVETKQAVEVVKEEIKEVKEDVKETTKAKKKTTKKAGE
jgi:hypothetical protein